MPRHAIMSGWWVVSGALAAILVFTLAPLAGHAGKRVLAPSLGQMRQLYASAVEVAKKRHAQGAEEVGYPAESGISTSAAYIQRTVETGYTTPEHAAQLAGYIVANVSAGDPPRTVFLVPRAYYDAWRRKQAPPKDCVVLLKGGDAYRPGDAAGDPPPLPPREPVFLEP